MENHPRHPQLWTVRFRVSPDGDPRGGAVRAANPPQRPRRRRRTAGSRVIPVIIRARFGPGVWGVWEAGRGGSNFSWGARRKARNAGAAGARHRVSQAEQKSACPSMRRCLRSGRVPDTGRTKRGWPSSVVVKGRVATRLQVPILIYLTSNQRFYAETRVCRRRETIQQSRGTVDSVK